MSRYPKEIHFIDTCVLLELMLPEREDDRRDCARYMSRLANIFEGCFSIPALGEFSKISLEKSEDPVHFSNF